MPDLPPRRGFDAKNRLPWLLAAAAIIFALVVLVRSELGPEREGESASATASKTPRTSALPKRPTPASQPAAQRNQTPQTNPHVTASSQQPAPVATPTPTPASYSLAGLVTDADGKPLPKASVRVIYRTGQSQQSGSAVSDAAGLFTVAGLGSADVDSVIVEAVGYTRGVVDKLKLPLPERLEIALSPLAGLDIAIEQAVGEGNARKPFEGEADFVLLQERTATTSPASLGIAQPAFARPTFVPAAQQHVKIKDGSLRLEELESGTYKASIRTKDASAESPPFVIEGAHRTQTTVTLGLKFTIAGSVVAEGDNHPIARATVRMGNTDIRTGSELQAMSDDRGRFVIGGVVPSRYNLTIGAAGFTTKTVEALEVTAAGPPAETTYTLSEQKPAIKVTVLDGDGKPVPQARLVLMMTRPVSKTVFSKTDDAGTRVFDNISAGMYSIAVTASQDRTRQKSVDVSLEDGQTTDVVVMFPKTTRVQGHARKEGNPYHGLLAFNLRGSIGMQTMVRADETGGYVVELEPGEYTVGSPEQPNAQIVIVHPVQTGNIDVEVK